MFFYIGLSAYNYSIFFPSRQIFVYLAFLKLELIFILQGRAKPNAQAAALIMMVRQFPDTLEKLSSLNNNHDEKVIFIELVSFLDDK